MFMTFGDFASLVAHIYCFLKGFYCANKARKGILAYLKDIKDVLCLVKWPLTIYSSTALPSLRVTDVIHWPHSSFWLRTTYMLHLRQ